MQFLGMGQFDMLFHHYPPVITHVLKRYMVRYTKRGSVDGEPNLILPPLTERVIECTLSDDDATYYHQLKVGGNIMKPSLAACCCCAALPPSQSGPHGFQCCAGPWLNTMLPQTEQRLAYRNILEKLHINPDLLGDGDPAYDNYKRPKLNSKMIKLRGMVTTLRKAAASALKQDTGVELYDEEKDKYIKEKWWYKSKAEAVIEILENRDEDEKVIVFSEYPDCLRQIKKLLPDIGLQSRDLIGGGSAAARGKAIRAFQTDPPTRVFLITHRAGGAGVTLTAGTHIILCEPTLNPSFARQAIGRSHRMGQEHPVTVTRLLMKSTIEEKIAAFAARWETEGDEDEEMAAALDEEDGEAMRLASTALEANAVTPPPTHLLPFAAANDETSKLTIEDLRDMINNVDDDDL
jgi:SNF2 family DNA or RNA helicase